MKPILYVITAFTCLNCFSQENLERTKRLAAEEKQRFINKNAKHAKLCVHERFEV